MTSPSRCRRFNINNSRPPQAASLRSLPPSQKQTPFSSEHLQNPWVVRMGCAFMHAPCTRREMKAKAYERSMQRRRGARLPPKGESRLFELIERLLTPMRSDGGCVATATRRATTLPEETIDRKPKVNVALEQRCVGLVLHKHLSTLCSIIGWPGILTRSRIR